jgi:uncharacterized protein (TIGR03083 family)
MPGSASPTRPTGRCGRRWSSAADPALIEPAEIAPLVDDERSRLLALLAELGDADWDRPTPCPGWTVLGLASHLVGDDLGFLARHRDRHHGTPSPPGVGEGEFVAWLDDLQAEWVRAARRLSPRLVRDLLAWAGPQVVETMRAEDPDEVAALVSWAGPEPVPRRLDQVRELSEYWIHRQQLLEALGRPGELDPALLRPILLGLRWAYPFRLAPVDALPGDTVEITISGPVSESWFAVATADGWDFRGEPGSRTVGSLTTTTDAAWRLLSNNLRGETRDEIEVTGTDAVVDVLWRTRAIIGEPK